MGTRASGLINIGMAQMYVGDCPKCGVVFGVSTDYESRRRGDHRDFYCPNGHVMAFTGPSKAEKQAKEASERADRLANQMRAERDQRRAAEKDAAETRAREVRLRWRVGNGVCPCCNRSFPALAAHVAGKHPEFIHQDFENLSTRMRQMLANLKRITEAEDIAVVSAYAAGLNMATVNALERRGLVEKVNHERIALTEAGWPLAVQAESVR